MKAIILFAHGSRDPLWSKPIEAIAEAIAQTIAQVTAQQSPHTIVRCAYLELMQPSLDAVVAELATQAVHHVRIVPMFLGVGKHAREDLPALLAALRLAHPALELELLPSIGEHPEIIASIASVVTKHL
ncbi:MAG: CbiX/SirB N-terminal domain-containing protein [Cytophagales bacterium]|nr:CbiX/SirB N-terminal domain-containing protein [Cytophagales bacterium]